MGKMTNGGSIYEEKYLAFLLAGCMTAGVPSMAWAAEQTTEAAAEETSGGEAAPSEETAAVQTALGTDVYSFQAEYAGNLIQLPVKYEDFTVLGWTLSKMTVRIPWFPQDHIQW